MRRIMLIFILIGLSLNGWSESDAQNDIIASRTAQVTDLWAVQLTPGTDPGTIAYQHNMDWVGSVGYLPDIHLFRANTLENPRTTNSLRTSTQIVAFQQQMIVSGRVYADPTTEPLFDDQWHLQNTGQFGGVVGADANIVSAWMQGHTGTGVNVAVIDDGIEFFHPDLEPNYNPLGSFDFADNDTDPRPESPAFEKHGVPVAGTIAAAVEGTCGVGVAYESGFSAIRQDLTYPDAVGASIFSYARDINAIYNASFSWGPLLTRGADYEPLLFTALADNTRHGRGGLGNIYVFAAGNNGNGGPGGLGENANRTGYNNSRYTIAVAASTDAGVRSPSSEFGTSVFVNAPSSGGFANITTTDRLGRSGLSDGDCTDAFGETSASAAIVSGVAALILDANPALTWRDVQYILAETATQNDALNASWSTNQAGYPVSMLYGFGRVNAGAATALATEWANVPAETAVTTGDLPVGAAIPEDGTALTQSVEIDDALVLEHVEVNVNIDHPSPGDLTMSLTAPSGTVSQLMTLRSEATFADDPTYGWDGYDDLTMMSVHHWAENAAGTWTLDIRDERGNAVTGVLNEWSLTLYGLPAAANDIIPTLIDTNPFTDVVNTVTASRSVDDVTPTCGTDAGYRSVWYRATPSQNGLLTLNTAGSDYDTVLAVYDESLAQLACDDDSGPDSTSLISELQLSAGMTYYIQASGDERAFGALVFNADFTATNTGPGAFTLNTPANGATFAATNPPTTLTWTAAANALTYTLTVKRDGQPVFTVPNLLNTTYTLTDQQQAQIFTGEYMWQVSAANAQGTTVASNGPFTFTVGGGEGLVRINPVPNSTINQNSVMLTWTAAPGAVQYRVVLNQSNVTRFDQTRTAADICVDGICTLQATRLFNGVYDWWIRPIAADGGGSWDLSRFAVEIQPDSTLVKRISPAPFAVLTSPPPTLSWEPVPGMVAYRLFLGDGNSTILNTTLPADEVCGPTTCRITAPNTLANGTYSWWMAGINTATRTFNESIFTLDVPPVGTIIIADPAPAGTVNVAIDTISFIPDPNALWYHIALTGPVNIDEWYAADEICEATTCTALLPETLLNGTGYQLWLGAWGPAGIGPYSAVPYTFDVRVPTPSALTNPSPLSGATVSGNTVTFTWDDDPTAAWYHLYIQDGAGNRAHETWYRAPPICVETTCKVDVTLPGAGEYTWWLGSWGPGGIGPYNADNATGYTFAMQ